LFSRNRLPQTIPALAHAIAKLPHKELILDGEIDWPKKTKGPAAYHLFDIMWLDGRDLTNLPLEERRALLRKLPLIPPLHRVITLRDQAPWERALRHGWEGVIAKRRDSVYEQRRSPNWLKMKCELAQEFVVGGFTEPQGKRAGLGALLVGYFEGEDFVFAGKVGTGFDNTLLLNLRAQLDELEIETAPFTKAVGLPRTKVGDQLRAHWVRPQIVVQVGFIQWTRYNKLRHPRLLGIRHDKDPREVIRE
jgi:bifunctional non-homologous end joining protein LigD